MTQVPSRADFEHLVILESPDLSVLLVPDDEARCLYASGAGQPLFGWEPESLEGHPFLDKVVLEDAPAVQRALIRARRGEPASASFRMECAGGGSRWCEIVLQRPQRLGTVEGILGVVRDITARRDMEAALTRQAETDPLTGVANRTVFLDRLGHALSRLSRSQLKVGVLFLDLDHFKAINDCMGHQVGDRILTATAQRLLAFLRPSDTLARLGGDEFAILLEDVSSSAVATALAERIASAGHFPLSIGGEDVVCTLSVGVIVTDDPGADPEELLECADRAMYTAKRQGRQGYEVFDERLRGMALRRLATESMIRRALTENRLVLQYQPIVRLQDRAVVGAEALVRIRSTGSTLVLPEAFLDVANETGLVRPIDAWVLRKAVLQAGAWQTRHDNPEALTVSLNLTARHLGDPGFAPELADLIDEHALAPGSLALEVTEDDLDRLSSSALDSLKSLRARGVKIVLDGFGAGSYSLTTLRAMPLDIVKVHRACVAELESSARGRAVVGAVIGLCHDLELQVLGLGVETTGQLDILTELDCDQGQGFLLGSSTDFAALNAVPLGDELVDDGPAVRSG